MSEKILNFCEISGNNINELQNVEKRKKDISRLNLTQICSPKQWKTIATNQLQTEGEYPVYGANGIIGYYKEFNHEKPTVLITCRGATCGNIHISLPKSYINGNAMALDNLNEDVCLKEYLYYIKMEVQ